ncbi:MAG: hypothetical protein ACYTGQ_18275 [Planctomycetota bacterium]|jgi:hypothetical protein
MRQFLSLIVLAATIGWASSAFAQDADTKTKFYNFDDMLIDGALKTPDVLKTEAMDKAKFKRLLSLKKSFLPKIRESAGERALN